MGFKRASPDKAKKLIKKLKASVLILIMLTGPAGVREAITQGFLNRSDKE